MIWKHWILISLALLSILSCSSANKRTLIGAAIGGTIGTVIGHQQQSPGTGILVGSAIGVAIGTNFGSKQNLRENKITPNFEPEAPKLLSPKVRRVWVPAKIEGDKYIDGHYMYIIEKQTTWSN